MILLQQTEYDRTLHLLLKLSCCYLLFKLHMILHLIIFSFYINYITTRPKTATLLVFFRFFFLKKKHKLYRIYTLKSLNIIYTLKST